MSSTVQSGDIAMENIGIVCFPSNQVLLGMEMGDGLQRAQRRYKSHPRCRRTDQFIRAQVQWQPASGRTIRFEPI